MQLLLLLMHAFTVCTLIIETGGHCLFVCSVIHLQCYQLGNDSSVLTEGSGPCLTAGLSRAQWFTINEKDQKWIQLGICQTPAALKFEDHFCCQWNVLHTNEWIDECFYFCVSEATSILLNIFTSVLETKLFSS